jgi:hypothetical protein
MKTKSVEDSLSWEKEFDRRFDIDDDWDNSLYQRLPGGEFKANQLIKDFIGQELTRTREETRKELINELKFAVRKVNNQKLVGGLISTSEIILVLDSLEKPKKLASTYRLRKMIKRLGVDKFMEKLDYQIIQEERQIAEHQENIRTLKEAKTNKG